VLNAPLRTPSGLFCRPRKGLLCGFDRAAAVFERLIIRFTIGGVQRARMPVSWLANFVHCQFLLMGWGGVSAIIEAEFQLAERADHAECRKGTEFDGEEVVYSGQGGIRVIGRWDWRLFVGQRRLVGYALADNFL
jgi:hypothetical protein